MLVGGGGKGGALCLGFPGFGRPCRATHPGLWGGMAPIGLLCMEGCLTQGLVALAGLRTLGFGKGRPAGASGLWVRANPGFGRPYRAAHPGL